MNIIRKNQTVWFSDKDNTKLLVAEGQGQYYIPLSVVPFAQLCELALALEDAILRAGGSERTAVALGDAARHAASPAPNPTPPSPPLDPNPAL